MAPDPKPAQTLGLFPAYNTAEYCAKISQTAGGSYVIEKACREQEADARDDISRMNIPQRVASYCARIGDTIGGSYVIYKTCIEQELNAAATMQ